MSPVILAVTGFLFLIPFIELGFGLVAPTPVQEVLLGAATFIVLLYASVWVYFRPTRFELTKHALRIVWPLRDRSIPLDTIDSIERVTADEFRRRYGPGVRIGAGGLCGAFGLLRTRAETLSMWISRMDAYVVVRLRDARSLGRKA